MKNTRRALLLVVLGACRFLCAQAAAPAAPVAIEKLQVSKTENADFPAGGLLRLKNAIGELTIEGWDQPGLEITTIKSTKAGKSTEAGVETKDRENATKLLDSVKIGIERKGDEVTVSTDFPKHSRLARLFTGMTDFDLEYRIKAPRTARLTIDEVMGEVHIDNIAGDIRATEGSGEIIVRVPEGAYTIDAKSKLGSVVSDFAGSERGLKWFVVKWPGQAFTASPAAPGQKLFLRSGFGDIVILKIH